MSRGAALSELVILAPLILLLLIGVVEAGAAGNFAIKIGNAARAGVQYGAQNHVTAADTNGMVAAATADADTPGVSASAINFCQCEDRSASTCGQAGACPTNHQNLYVQVTVSGTLTSVIDYPFIPAGLRTISLSQVAVMRVVQ